MGFYDSRVKIVNLESGKIVYDYKVSNEEEWFWIMKLTKDDSQLFIAYESTDRKLNKLRLISLTESVIIKEFSIFDKVSKITSMVLSKCGQSIFIGDLYGYVSEYSVEKKE